MMQQSRSGWEPQQSGTTKTLRGVSFTDADTGTAVGESSTILRTTNGGTLWSPQTCGLTFHILDVSFCNQNMGVACGTLGTIIYTTNGGTTWTTYQTGWMMQYYGAHMENTLTGILVGENSIFSPLVTWTLDGWQSHTTKGFLLNNNEGQLWDVQYRTPTTWYAAANVWDGEGAIARTTDGGANWNTIYWTDRGFFGMDFPSNDIGYVVGGSGIIAKTTDGGNTWNLLSSGVQTTLLDVSFASDTCGTAVGQDGLILRTENGGTTWIPQESGTTSDLYAVQLIDLMNGYVVGQNGVIFHTTTGGYPEDTTPPETTCHLDGTMNGSVFVSNVTVTLNATDDLSGVNYTIYKVDDSVWTTYTEPFIVSEDGDHAILFYSVDNAGNMETTKNATFTIQHAAPSLTIVVQGGFGVSVTFQNSGNTDLTNITWNLVLDGKAIFFGKTKSGNIPLLKTGDTEVVKDLVLGLGKTNIVVTTGTASHTTKGFVFLFYVKTMT